LVVSAFRCSGCLVGFGTDAGCGTYAGCGSTAGPEGGAGLGAACGSVETFGLGGRMSLSTHGLMPGSVRTSDPVAGSGSVVAALAAATSIGRSIEAPTATTMAKPSATTIAHAPSFSRGSLSRSRMRSRRRTSGPRYRPRRRIALAWGPPEMTSAKVRLAILSVGAARSMSTKVSTHPLMPCSEADRQWHCREPQSPMTHHILPGLFVLRPRRRNVENTRPRLKPTRPRELRRTARTKT
jgi:hypothetical protein